MPATNPPIADAPPTPADAGPDPRPEARLVLTDFVAVETLQEIQDAFASVTRLHTSIVDADGTPVTRPADEATRRDAERLLADLLDHRADLGAGSALTAPITVDGQTLGSVVVTHDLDGQADGNTPDASPDGDRSARATQRAAAVRFLYLIANAIAQLCYEQHESKQRLDELSALYRVSTALSGTDNLQQVLDTAARNIAEVMRVDAAVVRLLEDGPDGPELRRRANHGLSDSYINHGRLIVNRSEMFKKAFAGEVVFIEDLATDPRTYWPQLAAQEGLASMLAVGLIDQGQPVGSLHLYTTRPRRFTKQQAQLARAIGQLVAAAVAKHRLENEKRRTADMLAQLNLAADVQRRLLPQRLPALPGVDVAARYVPSYQLSGDFYDFIRLGDDNVGFAVGDVAGKGIAASLLMASVRSSLRAYAHDLYHLDQIMARVNVALCRDTREHEFATLWYGVLDPHHRRLTYCNAGHEPVLLMRHGKLIPLHTGGMIVGVDREATYDKGVVDLQPGDVLLLFTDGLPDGMNGEQKRFGRASVEAGLLSFAARKDAYTANDVLNHLLQQLRQHTGPRRNSDDTTLVCLRVHG